VRLEFNGGGPWVRGGSPMDFRAGVGREGSVGDGVMLVMGW